jgi:hypothetical protein
MPESFRVAALACVLAALGGAVLASPPRQACSTGVGACAQPGLPPCGAELGAWRVARPREAGLDPAHSHSACILAQDEARWRREPPVSVVPQEPGVAGDTLVSRRPAPRRDRQRAALELTVHTALPDHWAFAVAGEFLDRGDATSCGALSVTPPVNAGYALIGGNWERRPHGFYFERLADACVYDGTDPDCPGEAAFLAHEFVPGDGFALALGLARADDGRWWLDASVSTVAPGGGRRHPLGRMRLAVTEPCWLGGDEGGHALVVVIPHAATAPPGTRVTFGEVAWLP